MQYRLNLPPIGYSQLMLEGGKIFGKVPYLLLKLHEGNGTYFYDRYAFSCMNFYEFSSDAWISFFYEHHFNGFLLGRVPLLKNSTGAKSLFSKEFTALSRPATTAVFRIRKLLCSFR